MSSNDPTINQRLAEAKLRLTSLVTNAITLRQRLNQQWLDPRRNVEDECGYPRTSEYIDPRFYQELFERDAVAARVVEVYPRSCWQVQPTVYEDEDSETITEFEDGWDNLGRSIYGEESWYGDEYGNTVWSYLQRVDELSGIGQYGVMLYGFDDVTGPNADLSQPVRRAPAGGRNLLYLRCFPEFLAPITKYETNISSPRFGQPLEYNITFNDPNLYTGQGVGYPTSSMAVHWTRIQHVCDLCMNPSPSEVFAPPRMRPVLNNILGLHKLYASSPEMYWKGAFPGLAITTQPQLGGDVDLDVSAIRDEMEQYMNGLQRYLALSGLTASTLSPTVVDPTPQIDAQIAAICIKLGVPVRVFKGSERGELASTQDHKEWDDKVVERQHNYVTPRIIVPFIDRLIWAGVLAKPNTRLKGARKQQAIRGAMGGYHIEWPDITSATEDERAMVMLHRTQAWATYIASNMQSAVAPLDYMTRFDCFTELEAQQIIQSASDHASSPTLDIAPPEPPAPSGGSSGAAPSGAGNNGQARRDPKGAATGSEPRVKKV